MTDDVDELERLYAAPAVDDSPQVEDNLEWLPRCSVNVNPEGFRAKERVQCRNSSHVNMTFSCPFCGIQRWGVCQKHALAGQTDGLTCGKCSRKANVDIWMRPVTCVWKSDD